MSHASPSSIRAVRVAPVVGLAEPSPGRTGPVDADGTHGPEGPTGAVGADGARDPDCLLGAGSGGAGYLLERCAVTGGPGSVLRGGVGVGVGGVVRRGVIRPGGAVGRLGVAVGASIRHLPFGTPRAAMSAALTATLGELRVSRLTECGQGARTQLDRQGFSVLLQGTRFVGWTDAGSAGRHLTTADGVGVGSTLGQVRAQYPGVSVTTGTLGPEFSSPRGLSGLTTTASSAGKVTTIYAGESCFFR